MQQWHQQKYNLKKLNYGSKSAITHFWGLWKQAANNTIHNHQTANRTTKSCVYTRWTFKLPTCISSSFGPHTGWLHLFVWEEGLPNTDWKTWTLQQTEFLSFAVYCWSIEGRSLTYKKATRISCCDNPMQVWRCHSPPSTVHERAQGTATYIREGTQTDETLTNTENMALSLTKHGLQTPTKQPNTVTHCR